MKDRITNRFLLINFSVLIGLLLSLSNVFAESNEMNDFGDILTQSLVTAQASQSIYLGDDSRTPHSIRELMFVEDGITYLPIRLAFTGKGETDEKAEIDGIDIAVEAFMNEPSIKIGVQFDQGGNTIRRQVDLKWFTDDSLQQLNDKYGDDFNYFGYGITEDSPCGQIFYTEYLPFKDSEGNDLKDENGKTLLYGTFGSGPNGLWNDKLEVLPQRKPSGEAGTERVYISVKDFNNIVQFLVGDRDYKVIKKD